jgi:predicted DNA-binding transcriptional regulator AlpA
MTANDDSASRFDVASSMNFKSRQTQTNGHGTDRSRRSGSGKSNVAPPPLKDSHYTPIAKLRSALRETGSVGQSQLILAVFQFSSATPWRIVKAGTFLQPVKFGPQIPAWRAEDIRALIERLGR